MQEMNPIDEVLEQLQDIYQEELPEYMDKKLKLIEGVGTFPRHLPEFDLKGFLDDLRVLHRYNKLRRAESPIYQGGMSSEIVFEELVSTAETTDKPLGLAIVTGKSNRQKRRKN